MTRRHILYCGIAGELAGLALLWIVGYLAAWNLGRAIGALLWRVFS